MKISRTIGPLHFEDLEPHRFEDLVRQLTYDFRSWARLEATGRTGADEGVDILAIEGSEDEDATEGEPLLERTWIIQCKRERKITPKRIASYVSESLGGKDGVHGFILAAACDFSTKSRNAFRAEVARHGIVEAHLWGKAELEDALFLPVHDHLLFAYFGVSLQLRRRSRRAELSRRVSMKRALVKFAPMGQNLGEWILLRDAFDREYPFIDDYTKFREDPKWMYFEFEGHNPPDHLKFSVLSRLGWVDWETGEWDIPRIGMFPPGGARLYSGRDDWQEESALENGLIELVPDANKANIHISRFLAYDSILAVDEIGDQYNDGPHLLVEWSKDCGLFDPGWHAVARNGDGQSMTLDPKRQKSFFPKRSPKAG
ncbi:MAG: restriction endonuclease [Thermoanaerobaculia bacterium]